MKILKILFGLTLIMGLASGFASCELPKAKSKTITTINF